MPDAEAVQRFEKGIEDDDWYDYFEVNAAGELVDFDALVQRLMEL